MSAQMLLMQELANHLARSTAEQRRHWADQVVKNSIPIESLLPLLHGETKTAQRLTWLITDIGNLRIGDLVAVLPILFEMRDEMGFPGMHRSVAKWLQMTGVPEVVERRAIPELIRWVSGDQYCIASKSFAARALYDLVKSNRVSKQKVVDAIQTQIGKGTVAFSLRMKKILTQLTSMDE